MLHLLFAFTLSWTMPAHCTNGDTLRCPVSWQVYRLQPQSPTWVKHLSGGKMALPDSQATYWPAVVREDRPRVVAQAPWLPGQQGQKFTLTLPDSLLPGAFYVTTTNASGECPYWSNLVWRTP